MRFVLVYKLQSNSLLNMKMYLQVIDLKENSDQPNLCKNNNIAPTIMDLMFNISFFVNLSFLFTPKRCLIPLIFMLHFAFRASPSQTKTFVCTSDTEQREHFLHEGPVPGSQSGLHHLAGHFLPGEEVRQQCCCGAERQERHRGHS